MLKSISAYDSPALLNMHSHLTPLDLYETLSGAGRPAPGRSLGAAIAAPAVEFAAADNGWSTPIRRDHSLVIETQHEVSGHKGIQAYARVWTAEDDSGIFAIAFNHLATFVHSTAWGKAGCPPEAFIVQANWIMMAANTQRLAFVVLADKRITIYWVERDEALIERLKLATIEMARRLAEQDPPAIDAPADTTVEPAPTAASQSPINLDELTARYRSNKEQRSAAQNLLQRAEHSHDASYEALKAVIAPGAHHEYDGVRIHHNAKSGRLTEEKIDGLYFF